MCGKGEGQRGSLRAGLLYLTGGGGGCLAAHAGGVDGFGRDQIQVLVVRDLVEAIAVLQQLDVQILVDLLERVKTTTGARKHRVYIGEHARQQTRL